MHHSKLSGVQFPYLYIPLPKKQVKKVDKDRKSNGQRQDESRRLQGAPRRSHRRSTYPQDQRTDRYHRESDIHRFVRQVSRGNLFGPDEADLTF